MIVAILDMSRHTLPGARAATWPSIEVPAPKGTTFCRLGEQKSMRMQEGAS